MADPDELRIDPEPPRAVAEAIAAAVRAAGAAEAQESAWWRAGIEDSLRDELD